MGLDQHIIMAKNDRALENFWIVAGDMRNNDEFMYDSPAILWYNRKNYGLHTLLQKYYLGEGDNGVYLELDKEKLEEILTFLTHNPDFFGSFSSVPSLCQILYHYNLIRKNGYNLFYIGDY